MKTTSTRFLKAGLSVLLVLMLLFSSVSTGLAAVVDNAQTSANVDLADTEYNFGGSNVYYYYLNTLSWSTVKLRIWNGGWSDEWTMTNVPNTKIYYHKWSSAYNNNEGILFYNGSWGSNNQTSDIKKNATSNSWFSGTSNNVNTTMSQMNGDAKVISMISYDGGNTYCAVKDSSIYTSVSGSSLANSKTALSTATSASTSDTSASDKSASVSVAYGSSYTLTAHPGSTATFQGFSTTQKTDGVPSGATTSTTKSVTSKAFGATTNDTYYAYYKVNPAQYTTVYLAIPSYVSGTKKVHYWNGNGLEGDASITKVSPTVTKSLTNETGWSTDYEIYTAQIPSTATNLKVYTDSPKSGVDAWPADTYTVTLANASATGKVLCYYEYGNTYRQKINTLYADVTWDLNGGTAPAGANPPSTVNVGTTPSYGSNNPSKSGYTFSGWSPTPAAITMSNALSSGVTYTAQYTQNKVSLTVQAVNNPAESATYGTVSGSNSSVTPGTDCDITATPKDQYFEFKGWSIVSGTGTFGDADSASTTFAPTSNATIKATFERKHWTVTLDNQSATTAGTTSVTAYYGYAYGYGYNASNVFGSTYAGNITVPTKTGYDFGGYYTQANGAGYQMIKPDGSGTTQSFSSTSWTTLYAKWTVKTTSVTLSKNAPTGASGGVSGTTSVTATYGSAMPALGAVASLNGYTLNGYYDAASGGTKYYNADGTSAKTWNKESASATLYAQWTQLKYTVSANQTGGTGTVTISKTSNVTYGETISLKVVPPTNYKIQSITGGGLNVSDHDGTYQNNSITITGNTTFAITYVLAGTCAVSFANNGAKVTLVVGETNQNVASVNSYHTSGTIGYTSSKTSVATVASNGTVTAVAPGTATITAKCSGDNSSNSYTVEVLAPSISFDNSTLSMNIGATSTSRSVVVENAPATGTATYSYASNDTSVVTVSGTTATPSIVAKKAGTATITATYSKAGNTATATLTVSVAAPTLSFSSTSASLNIGGTATCTATPSYTISGASVTYSSSNTSVATVSSSGVITAVAPGSATITATYKNGSTTYATSSNNVAVSVNTPTVSVSPTSKTLLIGGTQNLTTTTTNPVNNSAVTYSTSNASVATVSSAGKITAVGAGSATITATYTVGSTTKSATCAVTVSTPSVSISDIELTEDGTKTLTSTPTNAPASGVTYVYSITEGTANASVSGTTLTALKAGTATVKVDMMYNGSSIASDTATVTINQRYINIYLTDNPNWGNIALYYYGGSGVTADQIRMVKIGTNSQNQNVYACKYDTTIGAESFIFHKTKDATDTGWSGGNDPDQTDGFAAPTADQGYWLSSSGNSKKVQNPYTFNITLPTVSISDKSVPVGSTDQTINATVANNSSNMTWTSSDTSVVALTTSSSVATINAKKVGTSTITVKAYSRVSSEDNTATLKTLNKTDAALEFIGASDTATVTVTNVMRNVTSAAACSSNGVDFTDGTTGGTAFVGTAASPSTTSASVSHGGTVYLRATATSPYVFEGWYANGTKLDKAAVSTVTNVTEDIDFVAKFVKTYTVTINTTNANGVTVTNDYAGSLSAVPAGTKIKVTATNTAEGRLSSITANGASYTSGSEYTVTDNTTFIVNGTPLYAPSSTVYTNGAASSAGGSITTDKVSCAVGETITYTASATGSYTFDGWYPVGTTVFSNANKLTTGVNGNKYTATMTASGTDVIAHFHKNVYIQYNGSDTKYLVDYNPEQNKYVVADLTAKVTPGGGANGDFWLFSSNTSNTAIAVNNTTGVGVDLVKSSDNAKFYLGSLSAGTHTTPVSLTITPTAKGNPTAYNVVATATALEAFNVTSSDGQVTITGGSEHNATTEVTVTYALADNQYLKPSSVTVSGVNSNDITVTNNLTNKTATIKFTMPAQNVEVSASRATIYRVTGSAVTNGQVSTTGGTVSITGQVPSLSGAYYFEPGMTAHLTATAKTGYTFKGWYAADDTEFSQPVETNNVFNFEVVNMLSVDTALSVVAVFAKEYYITGPAFGGWGGTNWVKMEYDPITNSYSASSTKFSNSNNTFNIYEDNQYNNKVISTATENPDNAFASFSQDTTGDKNYTLGNIDASMYETPITITLSKNAGGEYKVVSATATLADANPVTLNGATSSDLRATGYPAGYSATFHINKTDSQYVEITSFTCNGNATAYTLDKETGEVTFTMPNGPVVINAQVVDKKTVTFESTTGLTITGINANGYKPGDSVSITVSPQNAGTVINNFTATGATIQKTHIGDNWTINFVMGSSNVVIIPDVTASFKMTYVNHTTTGGTIKVTYDDNTTDVNGGYVPIGSSVHFIATPNTGYSFVGIFGDVDHNNRINTQKEYTITATRDTQYYAVFAKDFYITGDPVGSWIQDDAVKMTYDPVNGYYYYDSNVARAGSMFKITPDGNTGNGDIFSTSKASAGTIIDGDNSVTVQRESSHNNGKIVSIADDYGSPVRIYFKDNGNNTYTFDATARKISCQVYLSGGVDDMYGTSEHDLAVSSFVKNASDTYEVGPRYACPADQNVKMDESDMSKYLYDTLYAKGTATIESWTVASLPEPQSITVQTQIYDYVENGWNYRDMYRVAGYVIYYTDGTADTVECLPENYMGNGLYSASIDIKGDCYVVPIFYNTDAYNEAKGQISIYVYVDAEAVRSEIWGPFFACYTYGTENGDTIEYNGAWPGQLMIPTKDGKTYFQRLDIKPGTINGVLINNYMYHSCPAVSPTFDRFFNLDGINLVQTYDYKEPIYLYRSGYNTFTFTCKLNEDGYHASNTSADSTNKNTGNWDKIKDGKNINVQDFTFQPLIDHQDRFLDLTGSVIENPSIEPEYYIISVGDKHYDKGDYVYDNDYDGKWSCDWYIYDKNGNYITNILSGAIFDRDFLAAGQVVNNNPSGLERALGYNSAYPTALAGKTVYISYEQNNFSQTDGGNAERTDGQWTGNKADDLMDVNVKVGLYDGNDYNVTTTTPGNVDSYGEGYVSIKDGTPAASTQVSYRTPKAYLNAQAKGNYRFIGWFIDQGGMYVKTSEDPNYIPTISKSITYYAMFQEINSDDLVINHLKYQNFVDSEILSHNGTASMSVEIYELAAGQTTGGTLVAKGDASKSVSTAVASVKNGTNYRVVITTTPLNMGKFYAWYTDTDEGYEEILTLGSDVDKDQTVTAEFIYETSADNTQRVINIYSDVTRVTNEATLVYKYLNRFGAWRTYTVPGVELDDDECSGYEGNGNNAYVPTFKTKYTMLNPSISDTKVVFGDSDMKKYKNNGYIVVESLNKVDNSAPSPLVTQAFNQNITWVVDDIKLTYDKSIVTLVAYQDDQTYTLTCQNYDGKGGTYEVTNKYNYVLGVDEVVAADTDSNDNEFLYWEDITVNTNHFIVTYSKYLPYRITEDRIVRAVYDANAGTTWSAAIEKVTQTREFQSTSDYVYVDYLLSFAHPKRYVLDEVKVSDNLKYGVILVNNTNYKYNNATDNGNFVYPDVPEANVSKVAKMGRNVSSGGYKYYCYDLTSQDTTNKNRINYFVKYDNNSANEYKNWTFTAYAYIIDENGDVILSKPQQVQLYDAATAPVSPSN